MIAAIAVGASLLADALVFAAFAELLAAAYDGEHPHAIGWWAFALVTFAGFLAPRLASGFAAQERRSSLLTAAGGLALVYLLVRVEIAGDIAIWDFGWVARFLENATDALEGGGRAILGTILLSVAWARAGFRSGDDEGIETIPKWSAVPFMLATGIIVVGAATDRSGEVGRAGAAVFAFAVIALAGSQLSLSGQTFGDLRAGSATLVLLALTTGVAVVGLVLFTVVAPFVGPVVGPVIGRVIEVVLTILLTPFAWFVRTIVEFLMRDAAPIEQLSENLANRPAEAAEGESSDPSTAGRMAVYALRTLALLVIVGVVVGITALFTRVRRRQLARPGDAVASGAAGSFGDDLRGWLRSLAPRRGRRATPGGSEAERLYFEMLERAEHAGHPRPDGSTPREYLPELHSTFASDVTDDITRAFEDARYGGRDADPRSIADLRRRWHELG